MPKAVFYGELSQGKRDRGAPHKRFKDQLKRQLTEAGIDHSEWEALAEDREEWRGTIKTAADNFEEGRKTAAAEKRQLCSKSFLLPDIELSSFSLSRPLLQYFNRQKGRVANVSLGIVGLHVT